jgi:hypothetical protein
MTDLVRARGDLEWLVVVGAVSTWSEAGGDRFRVVTARGEFVLSPVQVLAFRRGVLVGWALPRRSSDG